MKHLSRILAVGGLTLAIALFAREDVGSIVDLLINAGAGLVLATFVHLLPVVANAVAWQRLLPGPQRPGVGVLTWATWVRESVNCLLPVARIGGEIVAYRIVSHRFDHRSEVAASLVADIALSVLSQAGYAAFGLALLLANGQASTATTQLLAGVIGMIPLGAGFVIVQRAGALGTVTRVLDQLFAGRFAFAHTHSQRFDHALRAVYARHGDVASCFAWQFAGWALGAAEIWLALYFLGHQRSVLDAIAIEALIQAVSSAAFFVPGALGVQEAGFVAIGAALGIDAATALALASARRLRDVIIYVPGLMAWQWAEIRVRDDNRANASP